MNNVHVYHYRPIDALCVYVSIAVGLAVGSWIGNSETEVCRLCFVILKNTHYLNNNSITLSICLVYLIISTHLYEITSESRTV